MTTPHAFMLDAETVAEALNISTTTLYGLARRNELPFEYHRLGKQWRFRRPDVEAFLGVSIDEALGVPA